MFDLKFYEKVNEIFYEIYKITNITMKNILSRRAKFNTHDRDIDILRFDLQRKTEKFDGYVISGFMEYIDDYDRYFNLNIKLYKE